MISTAYFITVETRQPVEIERYTTVAGSLLQALQATLGDRPSLENITKKDVHNARVEVEVVQTDMSAVCARVVVQADADGKLAFDKNAFSSMIRSELDFPVNITKRSVSKDEDLRASPP